MIRFVFFICAFLSLLLPLQKIFGKELREMNTVLSKPHSVLLSASDAGVALPGDLSSIANNPAMFSAVLPQYSISFDALLEKGKKGTYGLGFFDSKSSPIAAGIYYRQDSFNPKRADKRISIGGSIELNKYLEMSFINALSLGFSYDTYMLGQCQDCRRLYGHSVMPGAFLSLALTDGGYPVNFGFSYKYFTDVANKSELRYGLSTPIADGLFLLGLDALMFANKFEKGIANFVVYPKDYLNIRGSFGYNTEKKHLEWGGGFFLYSQYLRLHYAFNMKESVENTSHSLGLDFLLAF
jgi:hypothetical protein